MAATLAEGPAGLGAASPAQQQLQGPRNGLKKRQGPGPTLIVGGWALHQLWLFWLFGWRRSSARWSVA
ncbi:hypothetical protein AO265_19165 [Pseudomonas sp. ABAC61]|nr:hypothetical protein AO265_19165 [Pseudomonas sp. ABAC61]